MMWLWKRWCTVILMLGVPVASGPGVAGGVDIGGVIPKALVRLEARRKAREMGKRLQHWIEGRPMPE